MTAADILPPNVIKRIERIAAEADRTPAQIMKFILRDGIERTEESVKAVTKS